MDPNQSVASHRAVSSTSPAEVASLAIANAARAVRRIGKKFGVNVVIGNVSFTGPIAIRITFQNFSPGANARELAQRDAADNTPAQRHRRDPFRAVANGGQGHGFTSSQRRGAN